MATKTQKTEKDRVASPPGDLIDTTELARRLGVSKSQLEVQRSQGSKDHPPYFKLRRAVRYSWPEVEAWLASRRVQP